MGAEGRLSPKRWYHPPNQHRDTGATIISTVGRPRALGRHDRGDVMSGRKERSFWFIVNHKREANLLHKDLSLDAPSLRRERAAFTAAIHGNTSTSDILSGAVRVSYTDALDIIARTNGFIFWESLLANYTHLSGQYSTLGNRRTAWRCDYRITAEQTCAAYAIVSVDGGESELRTCARHAREAALMLPTPHDHVGGLCELCRRRHPIVHTVHTLGGFSGSLCKGHIQTLAQAISSDPSVAVKCATSAADLRDLMHSRERAYLGRPSATPTLAWLKLSANARPSDADERWVASLLLQAWKDSDDCSDRPAKSPTFIPELTWAALTEATTSTQPLPANRTTLLNWLRRLSQHAYSVAVVALDKRMNSWIESERSRHRYPRDRARTELKSQHFESADLRCYATVRIGPEFSSLTLGAIERSYRGTAANTLVTSLLETCRVDRLFLAELLAREADILIRRGGWKAERSRMGAGVTLSRSTQWGLARMANSSSGEPREVLVKKEVS